MSIRKMLIPVIILIAVNQFSYWFSRVLIAGRPTFDLSFEFEKLIPVLPWTTSIYLGCYAFWFLNIALGCYQKGDEPYKLFCAEALGKLICFVFFVIMPTAIIRPEVTEINNIWDRLLVFTYEADPPNNLFPSIHCYESLICVIAVWKNPLIKKWYKVFSLILTAAICATTLTTKQHYFVDIFAGLFVAVFSYILVCKTGLYKPYKKLATLNLSNWKKHSNIDIKD